MIHAKLEPKHDTIRARLLVAFLALAQPLVRGWSRYFTWLKFKRTPPAVIASREKNYTPTRGSISKLNFWTENGQGRERLLPEIIRGARSRGLELLDRYRVEKLGHPSLWQFLVGHQAAQRDRISWRPKVPDANQARYTHGRDDVPHQFRASRHSWAIVSSSCQGSDLWLWIPYLICGLAFSSARGYRFKKRVAELVDAAAQRCGFVRVGRKPAAGKRLSERVADYDFALPAELIASRPLAERDASRMLVLHRRSGRNRTSQFS